jgi:hypothetical protein
MPKTESISAVDLYMYIFTEMLSAIRTGYKNKKRPSLMDKNM